MDEKKLAQEVAKNLLKIKAVFLKPNDPFTWASGIKSPIYCDNRLSLSYPEVRRVVENGLAEVIKHYYPDVEVIEGTSTAGIAHAAIVSEILGLPMGYVRGGAKDHGRGNQIEGIVPEGKKVVVVEDLISTGKSSIEVVNSLIEAGVEVIGCVAIFSYGFDEAKAQFDSVNVPYYSLANFNNLVKVAVEEGYIEQEDLEDVLEWRKSPRTWRA